MSAPAVSESQHSTHSNQPPQPPVCCGGMLWGPVGPRWLLEYWACVPGGLAAVRSEYPGAACVNTSFGCPCPCRWSLRSESPLCPVSELSSQPVTAAFGLCGAARWSRLGLAHVLPALRRMHAWVVSGKQEQSSVCPLHPVGASQHSHTPHRSGLSQAFCPPCIQPAGQLRASLLYVGPRIRTYKCGSNRSVFSSVDLRSCILPLSWVSSLRE